MMKSMRAATTAAATIVPFVVVVVVVVGIRSAALAIGMKKMSHHGQPRSTFEF
jgi:hypothetical protein